MKIFKGFILLFFIIAVAWFIPQRSSRNDANANEFSSEFYADYHAQLKAFLRTHPNEEMIRNDSQIKPLIDAMEQPLGTPQEQRSVHENFVQQLRKLISNAKSKTNEQFLRNLIQWIYLKVDLREATQNYYSNLRVDPNLDLFAALQYLREGKKFSGTMHEIDHEDQYLHGNLPFLLFTLPNRSETKVLRMGLPLDYFSKYHWPWISPAFYPEFLYFLQNQPTGHLYVNLMKRKGAESASSYALEKLEKEIPHLMVVTLDKNSNFYWQTEKEYPTQGESEEFKRFYYKKLTSENGDFYWTMHLDRDEWNKQLRVILDEVHQNLFSNQQMLNRQERLDFIELSYLAILDHLADKLQPGSMNITCRQCMDRGPSLYVLWMLQKNLITDKELAAYLLAPPLLIHNRPAHPSRIERFISASRQMREFPFSKGNVINRKQDKQDRRAA